MREGDMIQRADKFVPPNVKVRHALALSEVAGMIAVLVYGDDYEHQDFIAKMSRVILENVDPSGKTTFGSLAQMTADALRFLLSELEAHPLEVPCGRVHQLPAGTIVSCKEGSLCAHCSAIRILRAGCLAVADGMEQLATGTKEEISLYTRGSLEAWIGRLRADVARVEGRTK